MYHKYDRPIGFSEILPMPCSTSNVKQRKPRQLTVEQQWKKGIADAYRRLQTQRYREARSKPLEQIQLEPFSIPIADHQSFSKPDDFPLPAQISVPIEAPLPSLEPLPLIDEPAVEIDHDIVEKNEHEMPPPPPPSPPRECSEVIIPFKTPPIVRQASPPSDRLHLAIDDTIVKPHRLINHTLVNMTHMSFHIDPEQCSSPKPNERKKKTKTKKIKPSDKENVRPIPPPPLFSSTTTFDAHAFFTQPTTKTKKQKKKVDISRPAAVSTSTSTTRPKKTRSKKLALYDFQDDDDDEDDNSILSRIKGGSKLLADDSITARFAKNSHHYSHQTSMASTKSSLSSSKHRTRSRHHHPSSSEQRDKTTTKKKNKNKNTLGIGIL